MKMEDNNYFNKYAAIAIIAVLVFLAFFMIKPVLTSIIMALILAMVLFQPYKWLYKKTQRKNLSAFLICIILLLVILIPFWFILPTLLDQSLKIYLSIQQINFYTLFSEMFPSLFSSPQSSAQFASILSSFVNSIGSYFLNTISNLIFNFPIIFIKFLLVFFILFFILRDAEILMKYLKEMLPFPKEIKNKLFEQSKEITISVLFGQIILGVIQGLIAGAGFLIFGVPNTLLLTILAAIAGIIPIIGTTVVWIPVAIYLIVAENIFAATGVIIFGLISTGVENFLRPLIVSYKIELHPALVFVGMVGGLIMWGFLGVLLGPLILAYLIIILELYRKKATGVFIKISSEVN